LERLPNLDVTLNDLSQPMLERATERIKQATTGQFKSIQGDIREIKLSEGAFDIVLAAAVLHHLRADRSGGMCSHHSTGRYGPVVPSGCSILSRVRYLRSKELMQQRYGEYLTRLKDASYRDHVFAYVEKEDTPRPLLFQLDLLRQVGSPRSKFFTRISALRPSAQ